MRPSVVIFLSLLTDEWNESDRAEGGRNHLQRVGLSLSLPPSSFHCSYVARQNMTQDAHLNLIPSIRLRDRKDGRWGVRRGRREGEGGEAMGVGRKLES